ncbi:hypothetical protein QQX98_006419 [Neonectria punicea]|uniref:Uncharacterized protein n=1 Tax=Neonectria punicea TaxID=979145 RepID=A0ABR1H0X5_9HYPO
MSSRRDFLDADVQAYRQSNYFIVGGDSFRIMRLVAAACWVGLTLAIIEVISNTTLRNMVKGVVQYSDIARRHCPVLTRAADFNNFIKFLLGNLLTRTPNSSHYRLLPKCPWANTYSSVYYHDCRSAAQTFLALHYINRNGAVRGKPLMVRNTPIVSIEEVEDT